MKDVKWMNSARSHRRTLNEEVFEICMNHGFNFFSTLPGSRNVDLIERTQKQEEVVSIPLVREESGVALSAGAYLGGRKTAMIFQNQGLGNMEGQLLALNSHMEGSYRFPNLYIISHRGTEGEKIQAQKPMGRETTKILDRPGIKQRSIKRKHDLEKTDELLVEYEKGYTIALTVKPVLDEKLSGERKWERITRRLNGCHFSEIRVKTDMRRYEAISAIVSRIENEFLISNIGFPSRELYHIRDRERNFYLTSSLGQTYMLALGLALTTEDIGEKIVCFEGDGGLLMNPGSLAIVASQKPKNLVLFALDNGAYGSTKNVPTYTSEGLNLSALALAFGFPKSRIIVAENEDQLIEASDLSLNKDGPFFIHTILKPGNERVPIIPMENTRIKTRFKESIQEARKELGS